MHKPPLLLLHEDVESVEFCRQGGGGAASTKTFDLAIRDRQDQAGLFLVAASPAACHARVQFVSGHFCSEQHRAEDALDDATHDAVLFKSSSHEVANP